MMTVDPECARSRIADRLPQTVRWLIHGTPLDFDFSRSQRPLRTLQRRDLNCDVEKEWTVLWLFGERDFAAGGGARPFLGVHRDSGRIHGLDVERDEQSVIFFLNSDIDRFVDTFLLFDQALRFSRVPLGTLSERAREIDPQGFEQSEWRDLAQYVTSDE